MSDDPEQQFFSDGIAEDLINGLARSTELIVRPRSSSFQFRKSGQDIQAIGRRLEVSHILEGSVRTSGGRVRVSAQLIDIASNRSIWSQRFDRELVGIFEVQDAITREILTALDAQLVEPDTSRSFASSEAYDAFLRGRHQFNRYDFADAERWLAKAVELDPGNAAAWALLADVKSYQSAFEFAPNAGEHRESRRVFLQRALDIDPGNARALAQRAFMDTHIENLDFQAAIDELARLATLHPNNEEILIYLGFVVNAIGHANAAEKVFGQVVKLAPLSMDAHIQRIGSLLLFNRVDDARRQFKTFTDLGFSFPLLSAQMAMLDRDSQALRAVIQQGGLRPRDTTMYEAIAASLDGDFEEARRLAESLEQVSGYVSYRRRAHIALIKRDFDAAFVSFADAVHAHEQLGVGTLRGTSPWRAVFPDFFADKRFAQMLAELGMDPPSTVKITVPDLPF